MKSNDALTPDVDTGSNPLPPEVPPLATRVLQFTKRLLQVSIAVPAAVLAICATWIVLKVMSADRNEFEYAWNRHGDVWIKTSKFF